MFLHHLTSFSYVLLRLKGFIPTVTPAPVVHSRTIWKKSGPMRSLSTDSRFLWKRSKITPQSVFRFKTISMSPAYSFFVRCMFLWKRSVFFPLHPLKIIEINLINLGQIFRKPIYEFAAKGAVCHNRQQNKFHIWKGLDHAVDPAGNAAHHIWVAALRHNTNLHLSPLFQPLLVFSAIIRKIRSLHLNLYGRIFCIDKIYILFDSFKSSALDLLSLFPMSPKDERTFRFRGLQRNFVVLPGIFIIQFQKGPHSGVTLGKGRIGKAGKILPVGEKVAGKLLLHDLPAVRLPLRPVDRLHIQHDIRIAQGALNAFHPDISAVSIIHTIARCTL